MPSKWDTDILMGQKTPLPRLWTPTSNRAMSVVLKLIAYYDFLGYLSLPINLYFILDNGFKDDLNMML